MEDLLHTVKLFDMDINVNFLNLNTRDVALADGLQFLRYCFSRNICDELLLFIGGNTKAIVPLLNKVYLFDSNSHDGRSLCVSDDTSVLLRFHDLLEVERYIEVTHLKFRDIQRLYFQL